jgi:predicted transglutaminase-like cysteine proteinase
MSDSTGVDMPRYKGILGIIDTYLRRNRIGEVLVSRGKLTPFQLKEALRIQKREGIPLGNVLLSQGVVNSADLRLALATQSSLRCVAALVALISSLIVFPVRQAGAGALQDIPGTIVLASAGSVSGSIQKTPLFGTGERGSADLSSFTKWSAMFDRFAREANDQSSQGVVSEWKGELSEFKGHSLERMASEVNTLMNKVRYIGDKRNWGRSDYWETPIEFLSYGGDCEDFAIAKYVSLRALGVPDSLMRVAIVKDLQKGIPHAILVVYTEDGPMILDNQIKDVTAADEIHHYKPIFSINRNAWWLHTDQGDGNPTQIASAAW